MYYLTRGSEKDLCFGSGCGCTVHLGFFLFAGHVSSAADVPVSPLSESQNRLLNNDQHANNTVDYLANDTLKPGELYQG